MKLRKYQNEAIASAGAALERGYVSSMWSMATGTGKTKTSAGFVDQYFSPETNRILFCVGIREVALQTVGSYAEYKAGWQQPLGIYNRPGMGVVMGDLNDTLSQIVIASPQTLVGSDKKTDLTRLNDVLQHGAFDLLILDEAHYSVAPTYLRLRKELEAANPKLKVLGMTATAAREDGLSLGMQFQQIVYNYTIRQAIREGHLCPINDPLLVQTNVTVNRFEDDDLPETVEQSEQQAKNVAAGIDVGNWCDILWNTWQEHGTNRHPLWFMPSVEHSIAFQEFMASKGIKIAHIDGQIGYDWKGKKIKLKDRRDLLLEFERDPSMHLTNCRALATGVDLPSCDTVCLAAPIDSDVLKTQMIGRGTRLDRRNPAKRLQIVDFALKGIDLIEVGSLLGIVPGEKQDEEEEEAELDVIELAPAIDLGDDMVKKDIHVKGNGLIVKVGQLFKTNDGAWYTDYGTNIRSLGLSDTHALVVMPPDFSAAIRAKEGVLAFENGVHSLSTDKNKRIYASLRQAYEFFSNYSLWHIEGVKSDKIGKNGRAFVNWKRIPAEPVVSDPNPEMILLECLPLQREYGEPVLAKKGNSWRYKPVSQAQLNFLRNQLGCPDTPHNQGEAAQLITHYQCVPLVWEAVQNLRDRCSVYGYPAEEDQVA